MFSSAGPHEKMWGVEFRPTGLEFDISNLKGQLILS